LKALTQKIHLWSVGTSSADMDQMLYEGHWVKVKVTAATEREHPYSRNVKRQSAITPVYRR